MHSTGRSRRSYLAGTAEKFQETFLYIFCSIFMMKKCNCASKRDEFVIIPAQLPWNRQPRSRKGFIGTGDMPKTQRLEHGEGRRCSVARRRAGSRKPRYSALGRTGVPLGGVHSLMQILSGGGAEPWQGPDGVRGDIVAPDTAVLGMIMCGTGSPLADGSGATASARGRSRPIGLAAGGLNRT
jgi:hypothetical protein